MFASLSLPAEAGEKSASEGLYWLSCHLEKGAFYAGKCASAVSVLRKGPAIWMGEMRPVTPFYPSLAPRMAGA